MSCGQSLDGEGRCGAGAKSDNHAILDQLDGGFRRHAFQGGDAVLAGRRGAHEGSVENLKTVVERKCSPGLRTAEGKPG